MAFTPQDKEFIHLLIQGVNARIDSTHDNLLIQINQTIELQKKTNGRVTKIEDSNIDRDKTLTELMTSKKGREKMNGALKWAVMLLLGIITLLFGNNIWGKKDTGVNEIRYEVINGETIIKLRGVDSSRNEIKNIDSVYWNDAENPPMKTKIYN